MAIIHTLTCINKSNKILNVHYIHKINLKLNLLINDIMSIKNLKKKLDISTFSLTNNKIISNIDI